MQTAMFNVNSIVHGADGAVDVELVFDIGRGIVTDQRRFDDIEAALAYIDSSKKSYVLFSLEHFIYPCKKISQTTNLPYYKSIARLESFDKLERFLWWAQDQPLTLILATVRRLEKDLAGIEILKDHEDYAWLTTIRDYFIAFCKEESINQTSYVSSKTL